MKNKLGKGPEHYDIVAGGLSDMGCFTATWTPGRFPLTDVLSLATWVDGKDVALEEHGIRCAACPEDLK